MHLACKQNWLTASAGQLCTNTHTFYDQLRTEGKVHEQFRHTRLGQIGRATLISDALAPNRRSVRRVHCTLPLLGLQCDC